MNNSRLTIADMYYLLANLDNAPSGAPDDPQAQAVYTVEANVIDLDSPIWDQDQVQANVEDLAREMGLRVRIVWRDRYDQCAFVGKGGGTIILPTKKTYNDYRPQADGEYTACTVLHELAHILTPHQWHREDRYGSLQFQSHGPEYVRSYLNLLVRYMDIGRTQEAMEYLGVEIAAGESHGSCLPQRSR